VVYNDDIICRIKGFPVGLWNKSKELQNIMLGVNKSMANEKSVCSIADKLGGNIDASKYKNIVLGIVFLKYISDRFDYPGVVYK
jgi:hypothetical protein